MKWAKQWLCYCLLGCTSLGCLPVIASEYKGRIEQARRLQRPLAADATVRTKVSLDAEHFQFQLQAETNLTATFDIEPKKQVEQQQPPISNLVAIATTVGKDTERKSRWTPIDYAAIERHYASLVPRYDHLVRVGRTSGFTAAGSFTATGAGRITVGKCQCGTIIPTTQCTTSGITGMYNEGW